MFPWSGLALQIEELERPIDPGSFWMSLHTVGGVDAGEVLTPYIPEKWNILEWEYVAVLMGPSNKTLLDRVFVGKSARKKFAGLKKRGFACIADLELLTDGSLVEIRSGQGSISKEEVYQRIYRREGGAWVHVAFRQEDRGGVADKIHIPGVKKYTYQRFYPWCLVLGYNYMGGGWVK